MGREIECAVLQGRDNAPPRTSQVGEIEVDREGGHDFYDFEAKYLEEQGVTLSCPAKVPDHIAERGAAPGASAAFEALGCEGLARVDCFYTETGDVIVNEINTMPGFTPHSMYPQMWAASGPVLPRADRRAHPARARTPDRACARAPQLQAAAPSAPGRGSTPAGFGGASKCGRWQAGQGPRRAVAPLGRAGSRPRSPGRARRS